MRQIFLMEKAYGTPLLSELASKNQAFQQLIQVRQPDTPSALIRWLSSSGSAKKMEPTWRNLSLVLHKIGLSPVALQMEDYLINENIRKEMFSITCTFIVSIPMQYYRISFLQG